MNEYQIHTTDQKTGPKFIERFYGCGVLFVAAVGLMCSAVVNDSATRDRLRELERARAMTDRYSEQEVLPTQTPELDDSHRLDNFLVVVQELIANDWPVTAVTVDGIATIEGDNVTLQCGVLDPTPSDTTDNEYPQYPNLVSLTDKLGVSAQTQAWVLWEGNIGVIVGDKSGADSVKTDKPVWVCSEVVVVAGK